jgi:hypothetical protein
MYSTSKMSLMTHIIRLSKIALKKGIMILNYKILWKKKLSTGLMKTTLTIRSRDLQDKKEEFKSQHIRLKSKSIKRTKLKSPILNWIVSKHNNSKEQPKILLHLFINIVLYNKLNNKWLNTKTKTTRISNKMITQIAMKMSMTVLRK